MESRTHILQGAELIAARSKITKDLPIVGLKEFQPCHSWLEGKQIQKCLEERYDLLKEERVEKICSLNCAEWLPEDKKAKVTKKTGKVWEIFGHHDNNDDWLLAEEALYLVEMNDLELYYGEVRLSIQRSYGLLLDPSNGCSLNEYRVYSFLLRNGFKLLRHSPDITVTRYEKQINLDQCLASHKREVPNVCNVVNSQSPEEDLCILEEDKEVITIEDTLSNKESNEVTIEKLIKKDLAGTIRKDVKSNICNDIICIDDDEEDEDEFRDSSSGSSSLFESNSSDSEDVVYVGSKVRETRSPFASINKFLGTSAIKSEVNCEVIDLCEEDNETRQYNSKRDLTCKTRAEILNEFPNAESSIALIKCPDQRLIPPNIVPKFNEYKVNLNVRPQARMPYRHRPFFRRPYFNSNVSANNFGVQPRYQGVTENPLLQKAQEMQVMALGMLQVATTLMSSANTPPLWQVQQSNVLMNLPPNTLQNHNNPTFQGTAMERKVLSNGLYHMQPRQPNVYQRRFGSEGGQRPYFRHTKPWRNFGRNEIRPRYGGRYHGNRNQEVLHQLSPDEPYIPTPIKKPEIVILDSDEEEDIKVEPRLDGEQQTDNGIKQIKRSSPETISLESDERLSESSIPPVKQLKEEKLDLTVKKESNANLNETPMEVDQAFPSTVVKSESEACIKEENESSHNQISEKVKSEIMEVVSVPKTECEDKEPPSQPEIQSKTKSTGHAPEKEKESVNIPSETNEASLIVQNEEQFVNEGDSVTEMEDQVTSWEQLKKKHDIASDKHTDLAETFDSGHPLLKTEDCTSIGNILSSLQIFDQFDVPAAKEPIKISFDLYLPNTPFKKSMKMLPNFRMIVLGHSDAIPTTSELLGLGKTYQDEIPFLFAVALEESISFYTFKPINLPTETD